MIYTFKSPEIDKLLGKPLDEYKLIRKLGDSFFEYLLTYYNINLVDVSLNNFEIQSTSEEDLMKFVLEFI